MDNRFSQEENCTVRINPRTHKIEYTFDPFEDFVPKQVVERSFVRVGSKITTYESVGNVIHVDF